MADLSPREQIAVVLAKQFAPKLYPFPYPLLDGTDTQIAVKLLSDREIDFARIEAQRYCAREKIDLSADPDFLEREVQRQLVWRCVCEPIPEKESGKYVPLFPSDGDVRDLPSTVVDSLFHLYLEHQDRTGTMRGVGADDVDGFVASVRKGGVYALSQLEHASLVRVAASLVKAIPA